MNFNGPADKTTMRGFSLVESVIVTAVLAVMLGLLGGSIVAVQRQYVGQEQLVEAQSNVRVSLDTILRFTRMAGNDPRELDFEAIDPDPDGNNQLDSIRLRGDWNPPDGDLNDRYEDITFSTDDGVLFKREPTDANPVEFADRIESLTFSYRDADNATIATPIASPESIVWVEIEIRTRVPDVPPMLFKSASTLRARME